MLNRLSSGRRCKDEVASDTEESGNEEADRVRISGHMHCNENARKRGLKVTKTCDQDGMIKTIEI